MHRLAAAFSALALAGCATSTVPIALPGAERYEFASAITARRLASCAALNARVFSDRYASEVEELVRPDNFQVLVKRIGSWPFSPIIVGRAAPVPGGSQITLYMSAELASSERADWIERMRKGCEFEIRTANLIPMVPHDAPPVVNPPPPLAPAVPPPAARGTRG